MLKVKLLVVFFICIFTSIAMAKKPPTMPNSYDACGVSARSFSMGYTGVAMPGSVDNVFYNSAGLGYNTNERIQIEAYASIIRNTSLKNSEIATSTPIDLGFDSFVVVQQQGAISWRTFSSNTIEYRNGSDFYKKQEHIKAITISAANKTEKGTSLGLNLSYLYGSIAESSVVSGDPFAQTSNGNGFTMDIGFMTPVSGNLFFGVNFENVFGIMWWENYDFDQLPFGIRAGAGYITGSFNLLFDWHKKFYRFGNIEDENLFGIGLEQYLGNMFVLRVGAEGPSINEKEKIKYTYGAGINISIISLSVAGEHYEINNKSIEQYSVSIKVLI